MSTAQKEEIIELEPGYKRVRDEGVQPFLQFIESNERQFFKAKEFIKLYDLIFKMCIQRDPYNWSEEMYERYSREIEQYLKEQVVPALNAAKEQNPITFLKEWEKRWRNQVLIVKGLSKLFMYLDRFYTPNTDSVFPLQEQGYRLYKAAVFDVFKDSAASTILGLIQRERENEAQDRHLLGQAVQVFVEMGFNLRDTKLKLYTDELHTKLIQHAGAYYRRVSQSWLEQDSCPSYLERAEARLNEERSRVDAYLNQATLEPLIQECYKHLLHSHQTELLTKQTGVGHLLETSRSEDLSRLFRLYAKYPEDLEPIGRLVHAHISNTGTALVDKSQKGAAAAAAAVTTAADENHSLVRDLIRLHEQYNTIVKESFGNHPVFQKALKSAFEAFINSDNRVSKLLAKYVHEVLKKGTKANTKDLESTLDNVVFLYGYITEKDVFERDYQSFLAQRLLNAMCESEHSEKAMIAKLKNECGYQWTNRLEGMFKDIQLSKDLMQKFKKWFDTEKNLGLTFEANVCTTGYWPSSKVVPYKMPTDLESVCQKFRTFYLNQHSGHKLEWRMDQGKAEVQVLFSKTMKRSLMVTSYQMLILLCFNTSNVLTFQQMVDLTGVPQYELSNHLLSLAHPKVAILLKNPNSKELEGDHKFMINGKFTSKLIKVQIPLLAATISKKAATEEDEAIQMQRRHQMDAAIVRIMKMRKQLNHPLLVAEVIAQLSARFKPKPGDIKKRIESLIEAEYLKRDDQDRSIYHYLA